MATLQATITSNRPRIDSNAIDAIDAIEAIINEYEFHGNFDSLTIGTVEPTENETHPHLQCFGHATFSPSKPILDDDGSVVDRKHVPAKEVLERLAPHLEEPFVVQTVGFEKCRFPLLASQWIVRPDGTIAHDTFNHNPEKPIMDDPEGNRIVNWQPIREALSLALEAECPDAKDAVLHTMSDALGNHAADLICTSRTTIVETTTTSESIESPSDSTA